MVIQQKDRPGYLLNSICIAFTAAHRFPWRDCIHYGRKSDRFWLTILLLSVLYKENAAPLTLIVKPAEKGHSPEERHINPVTLIAWACPAGCRIVLLEYGAFDAQARQLWCTDNTWFFGVRKSCNRIIAFYGEVTRFDCMRPTHRICFMPNTLLPANPVYRHGKIMPSPCFYKQISN